MPIRDKITLDPISKYRIYGRFPWKLFVHILIVIGTTMQAIVVVSVNTDYMRAQEKVFYQKLVSESEKAVKDYPRVTYLYNIQQLREHLQLTTSNMFKFDNNSLELLVFKDNDDKDVKLKNIPLYIYFNKEIDDAKSIIPIKSNWNITEKDYGPFSDNYNDEQIKTFLNYVEKLYLCTILY